MRLRKDGKAYDGGDAIVTALGQIWDEVSEIDYGSEMEHQANYSIGSREATSWSAGKVSHNGTISMLMKQAVALEKAARGNLLNIKPFDINVTFTDEYNEVVNDTITCKFASMGRTVNTDMGLSRQYNLFVLYNDYNNIL
ncbi:MAG: hypothetical protein LBN95_06005 [Prevotellaceae bacterium]|jgi:hypothetical protein|nr:hypothetical protein [Prevotellaceae bacterium]